MNNFKVLIVEDDQLIAHSIKLMIEEVCVCVGIEQSFENAKTFILSNHVDLVIIDVRLYGEKSGLDLGEYLKANHNIPFIFLTGSMENKTLEKIIKLAPSAYFAKPVQKINLQMAIEIVAKQNSESLFFLSAGKQVFRIENNNLLYANADHVYTNLHFYDGNDIIIRKSLKTLIKELPQNWLIQINRSTAINPKHIKKRVHNTLFIKDLEFKLSPNYINSLESFLLNF